MTYFKPGEIIDVAIKSVRVADLEPIRHDGRDHRVLIVDEHQHVYALPPQAALTRVAPADWPPQRGDVWADVDGDPWFVVEVAEDKIRMRGTFDSLVKPKKVAAQFGPLTLIHRKHRDTEVPW